MKIAIHPNTNSFSERWIKYCEEQNVDYKIVNAFDTNIIEQLKDCDIFMWHHHHAQYKDVLTAKKILFALEQAGIKVFPNFNTGWHFDDKVAQKYLLEAINAPLVPSYVFYDKEKALNWAKNASYPKVFKLKGGAGASNVKLVKSYSQAVSLVNQAFGQGFSQFDRFEYFKERYIKFKNGKDSFLGVLKGIARIFIIPEFSKKQPKEAGYIYFQDFMPNNTTDFRLKVVDKKCWGFQRKVRENDFRASGSGNLIFDSKAIPEKMVEIALNVSEKLGLQSVAFDFILDKEGKPLIVEISYGFGIDENEFNYGYWDEQLIYHKQEFRPQDWMIETLIKEIKI